MARTKTRNRVKELRHVKAKELIDNPKNWRTHPTVQRTALKEMLGRIGHVNAVIARETPEGLELIDGHLRKDVSKNETIPVLIVDLNEDEALEALATLDPIAGLAVADNEAIDTIIEELAALGSTSLNAVLEDMHGSLEPLTDPQEEWQDMPEFENEGDEPFRSIHVHFETEQDVEEFTKALGITLTKRTKWVYYPKCKVEKMTHLRYMGDE